MKHFNSLPFIPPDAAEQGLVISVIRVGECGDWHTDDDGCGHDVPCWAVDCAIGNRRHRRVDLLMKDLDRETAWLIPPFLAVVAAVFNHESPFGLLLRYPHDPEAPQHVWFRDKLYERTRHTGRLTYVCEAEDVKLSETRLVTRSV